MKKQCLKSWVGIFWLEILFSRGEFDWKKLFREGGGGSFPDTISNMKTKS